jgi:cytoskeletal protein CcmA (bactofilin family)
MIAAVISRGGRRSDPRACSTKLCKQQPEVFREEASVNYFSQPKGAVKPADKSEVRFEPPAAVLPREGDVVSVFGPGMMIDGNITCAGALHIHGRVTGEVHTAQLTICEGAKVEGKIVAQDTVIKGEFKGTIHGNTVKLQGTAVVDGEIYNRSLTIEQNAHFEGVARRLDRPVDAPTPDRVKGAAPVQPLLLTTPETVG